MAPERPNTSNEIFGPAAQHRQRRRRHDTVTAKDFPTTDVIACGAVLLPGLDVDMTLHGNGKTFSDNGRR